MDHQLLSSPEDDPWNRALCISFLVLLGLFLAVCIAVNDMFGFVLLITNFLTFYCVMWCLSARAKSAKLALAVLSLAAAMIMVFLYWIAIAAMPLALMTVVVLLASLSMTAAIYAFSYYLGKKTAKSFEASSVIDANQQKCDDDVVVQMRNRLRHHL